MAALNRFVKTKAGWIDEIDGGDNELGRSFTAKHPQDLRLHPTYRKQTPGTLIRGQETPDERPKHLCCLTGWYPTKLIELNQWAGLDFLLKVFFAEFERVSQWLRLYYVYRICHLFLLIFRLKIRTKSKLYLCLLKSKTVHSSFLRTRNETKSIQNIEGWFEWLLRMCNLIWPIKKRWEVHLSRIKLLQVPANNVAKATVV